MFPVISFNHFTLPLYFSGSGGWLRDDAPEMFARYCVRVNEELDEEYYPEGIGTVIRAAACTSGYPVYFTESGFATDNDERHIAYIRTSLEQVEVCLNEGIDIWGYLHWSAFDNYEWMSGFVAKFGPISIDRSTMALAPKSSGDYLDAIARPIPHPSSEAGTIKLSAAAFHRSIRTAIYS